MLTAIIFDVDGTLVDSVDLHARAWQEAFAHFGHQVSFQDVRAQIGKGGDQIIPHFLSKAEAEKIGEQLDRHRGEHFERSYLKTVKPFPAVRELMQQLHANGKRIALASSAKDKELDHYKQLLGIEELVDAQTTSEDAERSKPHPDIFQAALHELGGPDPAQCVVVGDSPYDAQAASRAGLRSVGVRCGGFPQDVLTDAGFALLHDDPRELLRAYREQGDRAFGTEGARSR